jgi:hypothetical protein
MKRIQNLSPLKRALFALVTFALLVSLACDLGGINPTGVRLSGQPEPTERRLFQGITYERIVRQEPRLMVIHVVTIDLKANGIKTVVTAGDPDESHPLEAETTSDFLKDSGLQLAINGDAFTPWYDMGFVSSPNDGDRVTPLGFAASRGVAYSEDTDEQPTLYLYQNNKASMNVLNGKIYNAISGYELVMWNGDPVEGLDNSDVDPRTAIGLNRNGTKLIIIVVDGRQSNYSMGATVADLAQLMDDAGAYSAMNMDGGGSSTLVIQGENGEPEILNSPVHNGVPGRERPVGNHLGFEAK